jgi:RNA polymerase-binding transcription factor DksA
MATKKAAPKKAVKTVQPAKKAGAKKMVSTKMQKPGAKKPAPVPIATSKKSAPAKKAAAKKAVPANTSMKAKLPAPKKIAPPPAKAQNAIAKTVAPSKSTATKTAEPPKKPVVSAPTKVEVKPAIKPLSKPGAKKEPPAKPFVVPKTSTDRSVKYEPDFTKSVLDKKNNNNINSKDQSGPTMRYSDAELTEFRELIMKKLDTAKKELAYLQGLITRKDESGDLDEGRYMTMEDGSMSMEREQLSQMASRQIQFIDHLEKAIMRIENKTYGICRVTGNLIDKARLRAVPHATLSIEAKQMMNK